MLAGVSCRRAPCGPVAVAQTRSLVPRRVPLLLPLLLPSLLEDAAAIAEGSLPGGEADACVAGDCTSQLKLPDGYNAELQLGPPEPPAALHGRQPGTLEAAQAEGRLGAVRYMFKSAAENANGNAGMGAKWANFRLYNLEIRWDDGSEEGVYNGLLKAMSRSAIQTYDTHAFKFFRLSKDGTKRKFVHRIVMNKSEHFYIIEPDNEKVYNSPKYKVAKEERDFMRRYFAEHGQPWLSTYGRGPPIRTMWPAAYVGQRHVIKTSYGHYNGEGRLPPPATAGAAEFALEVASIHPRVFVIENLMSAAECDHVIAEGEKVIRESSVGSSGGFKSKTRTSKNGWLQATQDAVMERLFDRFGDLLGIDAEKLKRGNIAEDLQVVRYEEKQHYAPHHDFGDSSSAAGHQRFLTLLLYISPAEMGGGTSFPKAAGGRGLEVRPPRGSAVLFYNMLSDGNADDLALHSGTHVEKATPRAVVLQPKAQPVMRIVTKSGLK